MMINPVPALATKNQNTDQALGGLAMRWHMRLVVYGLLIGLALLISIPFLWMVSTSLKESQTVFDFSRLWPTVLRWENYRVAWEQAPFGRYFLNSGIVSISVLLCQFATIIPAAYAFARMRFPGRDVLFILILATMMVPAQVTFVPTFVLISRLHWRDTYMALIAPFVTSAFGIFLLRQAFSQVSQEYIDAARLDGCSHLGVIRFVMLPICAPTLITFGLFSFVGRYNDVFWPFIATDSDAMRTLPIGLMNFIALEGSTQWNQLMAASVFTMLPLLILFLLTQRYFIRGIAAGGLKG